MRNAHLFLVGFIALYALQSCTERAICPAYQSAFIHDKEVLERKFSYFKEDSTPKILSASKDRYNIIEPVSYRKKLRSLQTIPMKDIYPQEEDSLSFDDDIALAERDYGYDSTAVISVDTLATAADSIYMISLKKEKFNVDQELYLWYLKDFLVYPDVRLQMAEEAELAQAAAKEQRKKEKKGFFKRLFGGKKNKNDSTELETNATDVDGEPQKEKKGLFGFLKKKNKKEKAPKEEEPENNDEAAPEEEDDGLDDF
ncbi:hypothetical protein E1176_18570 [Fulvivirga sp. RKSG066]|uniref:hypothetical protein n=1 Tax=Fulvivirga aurantia TaxID=2529383 RepID=UPI0012BD1A23|nr:hypothetical protein [Fulvivirga aurantia]MTI23041.1 hypothetical protein [Fulvivirga aurantia]